MSDWYDAGLASRHARFIYPYGDVLVRKFVEVDNEVVVTQRSFIEKIGIETRTCYSHVGHRLVEWETKTALYDGNIGPSAYLEKVDRLPNELR